MNNIPPGYQQAIVTAITVFLAFSLAFIRFWSFEAEGTWWWGAIVSEILLVTSILMQIFVLARALNLKNETKDDYNKTVKWFLRSVVILVIGLIFSGIIYSDTFNR